MNQEDLILQLKAGNELAFRQMVESSQDMVYNTVLGIVQDEQEAEDVSQEVFIQVYRSIRDFRGEAKLSTWLYRIAITKALDWQRKKKLRRGIHTLATWVGLYNPSNQTFQFHHHCNPDPNMHAASGNISFRICLAANQYRSQLQARCLHLLMLAVPIHF